MSLLKIFTSTLALLISTMIMAQDIIPCATPPVKSDWLKAYQKTPHAYAKAGDTTLYVPVTVHVVGTDAGGGYYSVEDVLSSFCQLNEDFGESNIQFFIEGEFNYINNTAWYNHTEIAIGYEMMIASNIPNTINCYIVGTAAGSGGYNLPSANAIALLKSNIEGGSHTWAHEIGHNLSVQHPFLGWEGNPYTYSDPTPTEVYYDYTSFKPIFYTDTIIIDTALVEYVARTNCYEAGDGFCDTPPDYLASGWLCDNDTLSLQLQKDPDDVNFRSNGHNFMNYAANVCKAHFTPEQIAAMRANLLSEKPDYLYNQNPQNAAVTDTPVLLEPIDEEQVPLNAVHLSWESVPNATRYYYEVNRVGTFSPPLIVIDGIVEGTSVEIEDLELDRTYHWRIMPFSEGNTCGASLSEGESFVTGEAVGIQQIEGIEALSVYPNLLRAGQSLYIELTTNQPIPMQANLYNLKGQLIQPLFDTDIHGEFSTSIEINGVPAGMYLIGFQSNENVFYEKIIIT